MRRKRTRAESGFALIAVMTVMVLLLAMAVGLHSGSMADTTLRGAHQVATAGFYAAEAGVNRGMGTYRDIFMSYSVPTSSDFGVNTFTLGPRTVSFQLTPVAGYESGQTVTVPGGRQFEGLNAIEYRYTANANSALHAGDTEVNLGTEFDVDYIPLFQFLAFYQGDLEMLPGPDMTLHGPIHSNGSIYLNAGATFRIADCGPSYSSPNYCLNSIPSVHMYAAGEIYRGRKDSNSCTGTVRISKLADTNHDGVLDTAVVSCPGGASAPAAALSTAQISTWLGAIANHRQRIAIPTPDAFTFGTGEYWQKADLRLGLDVDHPDSEGRFAIMVLDSSGNVDSGKTDKLQQFMIAKPGRIFYNDVPRTSKDAAGAWDGSYNCTTSNSQCNRTSYNKQFTNDKDTYACAQSDYAGACTHANVSNIDLDGGTLLPSGYKTARRGGFYNNREHAWVYMLNVNLHDLLAWNRTAGGNQIFPPDDTSDGGLVIYLAVMGPSPTTGIPGTDPSSGQVPRYGVRVFGTPNFDFPAMVDPTGVTIVSDQGIYIEGNYNVGDATHPKMPAAFLGDTVNVLSAGWSANSVARNDFQSRQPLASRPTVATTVNAAFIGGVDVTTAGNYNGGFENYPRFHENWSVALNYRGSFVSLGTPRHNNGAWCGTGGGCNIYNPPTPRNWDFDTEFTNAANLPPLAPRAVTVEQILFTENFR
ncbi:MAG: hypothetical protein U0807_06905 [Candidatus Binatia bacterium]